MVGLGGKSREEGLIENIWKRKKEEKGIKGEGKNEKVFQKSKKTQESSVGKDAVDGEVAKNVKRIMEINRYYRYYR